MVLTYRALFKTYPHACNAIVDFAHENRLLFEAALDEFLASKGIVVESEGVHDRNRGNKLVGYSYKISIKNAIGTAEPSVINDTAIFTRDIYAWQEGMRHALRIVEAALNSQVASGDTAKILKTNSVGKN